MKEKIANFLRNSIIGKVLETDPVTYKLEEGNLEGVYTDKMIFSDLSTTENGLQFHMTTVTREELYELNADGSRGEIRNNYTGTSVFRYELALRKSTGQLTGYMRNISTTVKDQTMEAVVYGVFNVNFDGNQLTWKEQQLLYRDSPAADGNYLPVAFDSDIRFYLDNGKAVFEYLPHHWNINPDTLEKTKSDGTYPDYISREK